MIVVQVCSVHIIPVTPVGMSACVLSLCFEAALALASCNIVYTVVVLFKCCKSKFYHNAGVVEVKRQMPLSCSTASPYQISVVTYVCSTVLVCYTYRYHHALLLGMSARTAHKIMGKMPRPLRMN